MDILIISGFLGAGKTSFIKAMTHATGRQFVVVENEFGELNLDGNILRRDAPASDASPEMKIWELTEGCICCSMNVDFSLSVLTIANTLRPDYLLVEPSGVALPGRVLDALRRITYEDIGLLAPVTVVDASHFRTSRRDYGEYFEDQVRRAGTVVLSRSEGLSEAGFAEIERELNLPPGVAFPHAHYSKWPREMWFSLLSRRLDDSGIPVTAPAPPPQRALTHRALRGVSFSSPAELVPKLEALVQGTFGRAVRAKGVAPGIFGDEWIRFDVVDGNYEITSIRGEDRQGEASSEGEMVVIGEALDEAGLLALFGGALVETQDDDEHEGTA